VPALLLLLNFLLFEIAGTAACRGPDSTCTAATAWRPDVVWLLKQHLKVRQPLNPPRSQLVLLLLFMLCIVLQAAA
jgi:hypothetical protein